ncbi:hypothetical protein Y032_0089g2274 [Ancylostoma ceylanicum]|uniref:Uncharacterized protein n=1 Tax=Ancylostoma ceylanicum TaxID=53326 RepID=A0A016TNE8_9BILA|nr:hypothetical protein Y032_0089g2274 [Ancylostoma ceylanicum]
MRKCYGAAVRPACTLSSHNVDLGLLVTFYGCRSRESLMALCHGSLQTANDPEAVPGTFINDLKLMDISRGEGELLAQEGSGGESSSPDVPNSIGGTKSK